MRHSRIETFDLNLLRIFDALLRHGTVNSAASEIGVSSSAVSHALGRLRYIFDDELFVKGPGGMGPTARAADIADRVAAVLIQVRSILGPTEFNPETSEWHFKLRCTDYVGCLILPNVMKHLRYKAPNVKVTVDFEYSKSISDELDAGLIDLAIGAFAQVPARFDFEDILSDHWVWVLRSDHPCLSSTLTADVLLQLPQLVIASKEIGRSIDGVVADAGLERIAVADKIFLNDVTTSSRYGAQVKGIMIANNPNVAPAILAESDLIALLPERLVINMSRLYKLETIKFNDEEHAFMHRMIWHRKHAGDPAIDWLRSIFRTAASEVENRSSLR
jgi:DNA-binding transcriptional LysR family regulator